MEIACEVIPAIRQILNSKRLNQLGLDHCFPKVEVPPLGEVGEILRGDEDKLGGRGEGLKCKGMVESNGERGVGGKQRDFAEGDTKFKSETPKKQKTKIKLPCRIEKK